MQNPPPSSLLLFLFPFLSFLSRLEHVWSSSIHAASPVPIQNFTVHMTDGCILLAILKLETELFLCFL